MGLLLHSLGVTCPAMAHCVFEGHSTSFQDCLSMQLAHKSTRTAKMTSRQDIEKFGFKKHLSALKPCLVAVCALEGSPVRLAEPCAVLLGSY